MLAMNPRAADLHDNRGRPALEMNGSTDTVDWTATQRPGAACGGQKVMSADGAAIGAHPTFFVDADAQSGPEALGRASRNERAPASFKRAVAAMRCLKMCELINNGPIRLSLCAAWRFDARGRMGVLDVYLRRSRRTMRPTEYCMYGVKVGFVATGERDSGPSKTNVQELPCAWCGPLARRDAAEGGEGEGEGEGRAVFRTRDEKRRTNGSGDGARCSKIGGLPCDSPTLNLWVTGIVTVGIPALLRTR